MDPTTPSDSKKSDPDQAESSKIAPTDDNNKDVPPTTPSLVSELTPEKEEQSAIKSDSAEKRVDDQLRSSKDAKKKSAKEKKTKKPKSKDEKAKLLLVEEEKEPQKVKS